MSEPWEPRIVAFVCNWCTYAGADLAGTSRYVYAPNVRIVRLPCSGRIDPRFVIRALEQGADGVLVSGCHPGDCHYTKGNFYARRRYIVFNSLLDFLGIEPDRVRFAWVSAAEGAKWAELVDLTVEAVRALGPLRLFSAEQPPPPALAEAPHPEVEVPPPSTAQEQALRRVIRDLLQSDEVEVVAAYTQTAAGAVVPAFITSPEQADTVVWNDRCVHNLTTYLIGERPAANRRAAVVVKGCDARSAVGLIQESQLDRERVKLIGVECRGVRLDGGVLAAKCSCCEVTTPHLCDVLISADGTATKPEGMVKAPTRYPLPESLRAEIDQLLAIPREQRLAFWRSELSRCVRCYACRAICPLCYCQTCAADRTRPQYIAPGCDWRGAFSWGITRMLHMTGRCVGCGECVRACPQRIRLDLLQAFLADLVAREFGYVAGTSPEALPPLATFRPDDRQDFIR
ncbi:MAG: hydrogenase iron-sulfur subunit [Armatimonadota bacterium]